MLILNNARLYQMPTSVNVLPIQLNRVPLRHDLNANNNNNHKYFVIAFQ